MLRFVLCFAAIVLCAADARGGTIFVEAEKFTSAGGWTVAEGPIAKRASGMALLGGASGAKDGTASAVVQVKDAGRYKVWVRFASHPKWRGPFHVTALAGERVLGDALFDEEFVGKNSRETEAWKSFDVVLPEGDVTLRLSKHENKNSAGISRLVDCLLLTMDEDLVPNHLHFGAQTYVRVTLGAGYAKPAYLHVFADHYHAPWYQHFHLSKAGGGLGIQPKKTGLMTSGERSVWCNLSPIVYQDSGAMLNITARYGYTEHADHLRAKLEFATAPDEKSIVRTIEVDNHPAALSVYVPPNLLTEENLAHFQTDMEIAEATGKAADAHAWPTHGRRPERFPFFATARVSDGFDERVAARERKTLDYFGFTDHHHRHVRGVWFMLDESYCRPDLEKMQARAAQAAAEFKATGGDVKNIVFAELMDEPTGQPLEFIAKDEAYRDAFRAWLKKLKLEPVDLLVDDWNAVRPVTFDERHSFPALYLYSQRFRTRALGDFMAVQRRVLEAAYGGPLPTLVNFSDGAVYTGNFYTQGVDYFELLDADDQNAIWGEDWAAGSSTYQCASFNVDLMRAAARERGQTIGHHLVAHAGRKPWDVKLKATSEAARGVKIFNNFCYGPSWATHEGGPYYRSHVWYAKPETWTANASITREVGAVEDLLVEAMPAPAEVALLYSSATDAWSAGVTYTYGFDRMHTWLALAHEQVPVDVVHEGQAARGRLDDYRVCYLSGKHLSRAAAEALRDWVRRGGVLFLTAGAATFDEFNRPSDVVDELLPAERGECVDLQTHLSSGKYLRLLAAKDRVTFENGKADVLGAKQSLAPRGSDAATLAQFADGSSALVRRSFGKGTVYCAGFLPGLSYVKPALDARYALEEKAKADPASLSQDDAALVDRSANPWDFPADVRSLLLAPVREAKVAKPIACNTPLVDAVYMMHDAGLLVPLANYTNRPIEKLELKIRAPRKIASVESAVRGPIPFRQTAGAVELSLPLENNDFVKLRFAP